MDILTLSPNMQMPDEGIDLFVDFALQHNPRIRILVQRMDSLESLNEEVEVIAALEAAKRLLKLRREVTPSNVATSARDRNG